MSGESGAPQACERRDCGRPAQAWVSFRQGPDGRRSGYCLGCLRDLAQAQLDAEFARNNPIRSDPETGKFHVHTGRRAE